jgi:hypothetical protein
MSFPTGIHLAFIPIYFEDNNFESFKMVLVNNTNYTFDYEFELKVGKNTFVNFEGDLPGPGFVDMEIIAMEEFNNPVKLISLFKLNNELFEKKITLKPVNLFLATTHIHIIESTGFHRVILLSNEIKNRLNPKVITQNTQKKTAVKLDINTEEMRKSMLSKKFKLAAKVSYKFNNIIDLHAEKLTTNLKHIQSAGILEMQLQHVDYCVDQAILNTQHHLVFIHGMGNGVLKKAIFERLKSNTAIKSIENKLDGRFGFGATEVLFK